MRNIRILTSPAGAALVMISFFLPWARVSCSPVFDRTVSGASLGGAFWLMPLFAGGAVAVFFLARWLGKLGQGWAGVTLLSAAALVVFLVQCLRLASRSVLGVGAEDVGISVKFGGVATIVGLVAAVLGSLPGGFRRTGARADEKADGGKRYPRRGR